METYFTIDTLLQGFVAVFLLVIGGMVFFTDHLEKRGGPSFQNANKSDTSEGVEKKTIDEVENKQKESEMNSSAAENVATTKEESEKQARKEEITQETSEVKEESISSLNEKLGRTMLDAIRLVMGFRAFSSSGNSNITIASKSISYILIMTVLIFVMGIFSKTASDKWLNNGNAYHLGNKAVWTDTTTIEKTSKAIRRSAFDKVYEQELDSAYLTELDKGDKDRHYYFTKHMILYSTEKGKPKYPEYKSSLENSMSIIDYAGVFALSFFILYIMSWLNLLSIQARTLFDRNTSIEEKDSTAKKARKYIYSILVGFCVLIIFIGLFNISSAKDLLPGNDRYWYFACINLIPILIWMYFWTLSRPRFNGKFGLQSAPSITYKDIFIKHYYTIIFLYVGLFGYISASVTWREAEKDKHAQVFGMYKNLDDKFKANHKRDMDNMFQLEDFNETTDKKNATGL